MEYRGYRLPTQAELDAMKNVDVSNVDKSDLVNIEDVVVDGSLPHHGLSAADQESILLFERRNGR